MIPFAGRGILLDIEGTTSSIEFVYEVLFPYARQHLTPFLKDHWGELPVVGALELIARDLASDSFDEWRRGETDADALRQRLEDELFRMMELDVKATGLKELQGLIWKHGYEAGELRSHVFGDVPAALAEWDAKGIDIRIFSSGSIAAQRVFFTHTEAGDLNRYIRGNYDTTLGSKRDPASYHAIVRAMDLAPYEVLF